MSFLTYRLNGHLRTVDEGATQAHYGEVEAIIKQNHAQARVQVYSELVANRLAALIGVDVVTGALVAHDTGLKFASLRLSNIAAGAICIETEEQFDRATSRYASQCAKIAVFDLWIGNEDRGDNLMASIGKDAEHVEERLAGSGRCVHGLFGSGKMGTLECCDDDLKIVHGARQPVDARDHQRLVRVDEIEDDPELGTTREGGAVAGLGASCGIECRDLGIGVLVHGRDPGIADAGC